MAWSTLHWKSDILGKQTTAEVLLPETGKPPYATFYLLHGLSDDSTTWLRRTRLEWYVRDLPLIVVMPSGYRGFYTDNHQGPAYARHIGEELPTFVERTFHAKADRGARAIGGLSMGGYGALMAEAYPTEARATAQNTLFNIGRGLGGFGPVVVGMLVQSYSFPIAIGMLAAIYVIDMIATIFLVPELKGTELK